MTNTVITYPTPPYSNLPIEPQNYLPNQFFISSITRGLTTTITTSVNLNFVIGQIIRLLIPPLWGAYQLNEQQAIVISIPSSNQVIINLNSNNSDPLLSSSPNKTKPQIVPIGDINYGVLNKGRSNNGTFIPGSFINISPNF